ncbi:uncharacterized protein [Haliotis cracherodii]|uniref:uncharacterized protein n=1 Tax=Haliotis cracherodii TaxID=6455 RepID=UPI0039EC076B
MFSRLQALWLVCLGMLCVGVTDVNALAPCADCEFYYVEIFYPTQGVPLYSQPSFSAAGQLLFNYAPKVHPIHVFQVVGAGKIAAIVKVMKPGVLSNMVVEVTNLGMEIDAVALYSFEAFALFAGAPPPLAVKPLRVLPCPRVYLLEMAISPAGNSSEYRTVLGKFAKEILQLKKAGIIMDAYKFLATVPSSFMILGCGTPTFYDQLTLSMGSLADDYGSFEVGRATALTKWNPLIGGKGGACFWGGAAAGLFPTGKK